MSTVQDQQERTEDTAMTYAEQYHPAWVAEVLDLAERA
jgi:hypothetical protein